MLLSQTLLQRSLLASVFGRLDAGPWLFELNHWLLATMVRLFPHTDERMNLAQFFIHNRLVSGWVFAAACYFFWYMRDERTDWRRARIIEASVACVLGEVAGVVLRQFIGASAPARTAGFQQLFPPYLWNWGTGDSFPSDSTLVYFTIAAGLWPINRTCSAILCAWTLLGVSLPRVYLGGHYPSDVAGAVLISAAVLLTVWKVGATRWAAALTQRVTTGGNWMQLVVFAWLFELGDGFHSAGEIAIGIWRLVLRR